MQPQRNSRSDWRWRVALDRNGLGNATEAWLLTTPTANTTAGRQEFPALIPGAHDRAKRYGASIRSQYEVTGSFIALTFVAAASFIPPDFPNPRGYRRSVELLTWLQTRRPIYDDQEVEPFSQSDWPVPKGRPFPLEDRGFIAGTPLLLSMPPFAQTDWPVPKGRPFPTEDRGFVSGSPLIVIAQPFHQDHWPVPKGYKFPPSLRGYILPSSPDRLLTPFSQLHWPVPRGRPFPPHLRGYLLPTDRLLIATPFNQLHWPVPRGRPYPVTLRFLGPQVFLYIVELAGYGRTLDSRAYGGRTGNSQANSGLPSDAKAYGGSLWDMLANGGEINDERAYGGRLQDG